MTIPEKCLRGTPPPRRQLTYASIISALSFALDLTQGACPGHSARACILGMKIGQEVGLPEDLQSDLYYALLLKDIGCSSNAARLFQIVGDDEIRAKRVAKTFDWTRFEWKQMEYLLRHAHRKAPPWQRARRIRSIVVNSSRNAEILIRLRCEQGARVARDLGLNHATAGAIYCLDEHWDGAGYPDRLVGEEIPLLARIMCVAQTLDVFQHVSDQRSAMQVIRRRSGRWFDPAIVEAAHDLDRRGELWEHVDPSQLHNVVAAREPQRRTVLTDSFILDNICVAFADVVDTKSHYTFMHSSGVAEISVHMAREIGLSAAEVTMLRRAALLHDIGKLGVPNSILDKEGALTPTEWATIKQHPFLTYEILSRIEGFEEIAWVASTHHERLDGTGYHRGLRGDEVCMPSRILAVADIFDALTGDRPYRDRMTAAQALSVLQSQCPHALDEGCVHALANIVTARSNRIVA
jgi:putative nucleotidyltransferase with HDIG domain